MTRRFKLDENMPREAAVLLRQQGFDTMTVLEQQMQAAADPAVFDVCQKEGRTIITFDMGFANPLQYDANEAAGIVVFRLHRHSLPLIMRMFRSVLPLLREHADQLPGNLWIVEPDRVRIRGRSV